MSSQSAADVVVIGETMVLFWPREDTIEHAALFERSFGGAESNTAIALSRLGHRTRWISRLGDDAFGRYIRAALEAENVLVDAAIDPVAPTAVFFKERVRTGPRRVLYYRRGSAASRLGPADLDAAAFEGVRVVHLTGITPALSPSCAAATERAIDLARAAGATVSFDPNVRPSLWPNADDCRATLCGLLGRADLVLLGHEDAEMLYPGLSEEEILAAIHAQGPRTVVLKLGERGARALDDDAQISVAAYPVDVVDTVGAGDGFNAGYIAGLLRGLPLEERLALGARVGAAAVSVSGDWEGYPTATALGP